MQRGPKRKWDLKTAPWVGKRRASETGSVLCSWLTNRDSYCSGKFIIPPIIEGTPLQTNLEPKIEAGKMISLLKGLIFRFSILSFQGNSFFTSVINHQPTKRPLIFVAHMCCPPFGQAYVTTTLNSTVGRLGWVPRWVPSAEGSSGVEKNATKPCKRDVIHPWRLT